MYVTRWNMLFEFNINAFSPSSARWLARPSSEMMLSKDSRAEHLILASMMQTQAFAWHPDRIGGAIWASLASSSGP